MTKLNNTMIQQEEMPHHIETGYMDFYSNQYGTETTSKGITSTKRTPNVRKPSKNQVKYYHLLCEQRNIKPVDVNEYSFDEISDMIKKLQSFYPASKDQLELIETKVSEISEILGTMDFTEEQIAMFEVDTNNIAHVITAQILRDKLDLQPILEELTGGRKGTASALIGKLIKAEKYFMDKQPITDSQVETIVGMFLCPDVDFESHDIPRRIDIDVEEGTWRKPTPQELAENIRLTFNKKTASDFLNKASTAFYEWKKTRIRPEQLNYIKQLEAQLANDSKLREHRQAVNEEGEQITVGKSANIQVDGTAYVQHTDEELIHFSIEQASDFINQLKSEVNRKSEFSLEDEIFETPRGTSSIEEALEKEYETLSDMMYSLEAIAGYQDEELHACATYIVSSSPEVDGYEESYIRDFIKDMIANEAITYMGVLELASNSTALQEILLNM